MRTLLTLLLLLVSSEPARADVSSALDEYFTRLTDHGFSGAVLAARGEQIVLRKGYGLADRQRGIPARPDTAFNIASLDKQFIAAGILRLEEMGRLRVTDTLDRFFDAVPEDKKGITLHQVLSHTAGFPDEYWDEHEDLTRADFIRWVLTQRPLLAPPGTRWSYASFDYWLLEEVIERASGLPFEAFLRRELFEPAGMPFTGAALPKWDRGNVARYALWTLPDSVLPGEARFTDPLARPPAWRVLLSTADDLHRWYLVLRDGRVLTPESRRKLFTPVMENYACGWNVVPTARGTRLIHHGGGGNGGSVATFRWFVDEDVFVTVLNNSLMGGFSVDYVMADVEAVLFGGSGMMPPPSAPPDPASAAKAVGIYRLPHGGTIEVVQAPHGPLVARSLDPEAVAALRFGGTEGSLLPQDALAMSAATEKWGPLAAVDTLHYRAFSYQGVPETHAYLRLRSARGDEYVRAIHFPTGRIDLDLQRAPPGIEAVLAPSDDGGYTTWDPRLGHGVRLHFTEKELHLTGSGGTVTAARVASEAR